MSLFSAFRPAALLALLLLATPLAAQAATEGRVGIAATVNDDVVTLVDLDSRVKLYAGGRPTPPAPADLARLRQEVLERLIDESLQLQEAKSMSVEVSDEQIAQGFAEIARQNKTTPEGFRDRLQKAGVNLDTLRAQIRAEIAWSQVVRRKLRPQVNVSEQDIDSALAQRNRAAGKAEYHMAEIFLASDGGDGDKRIADEANEIYQSLQKGARFSEIARARSQSPGAANGGDIGWLTQDQIDPAIAPHLTAMQGGQVTPPIKTAKGYYIIFLRNKREGGMTAPTAMVSATPAATVGDAEPVLMMKQLTIPVAAGEPAGVIAAKTARAQALAAEVTGCDALDAIAKEFNTQTAGGPQKISTLPAPIASALNGISDGALSKPVRTTNGVSVFMVCSRATPPPAVAETPAPVPPAASSEETARDSIASEIGSTRLAQMQERYLRDLRATAFIERRLK